MEQELAMLAEEAEEDRKRRDEEAADRIVKRAQVVNVRGIIVFCFLSRLSERGCCC